MSLFDLHTLDDNDPFEIDAQAAHLFKHPRMGTDVIKAVWSSAPVYYPAKPPAHWLMVVPLAPSRVHDPRRCRPIGCYIASQTLANQYRRDR